LFTFDNKYFRMMLRKCAIEKADLYAKFEGIRDMAIYWSSGKTTGHEQAGCDLPGRAAEGEGCEDSGRLAIRSKERRGLRTTAAKVTGYRAMLRPPRERRIDSLSDTLSTQNGTNDKTECRMGSKKIAGACARQWIKSPLLYH
jgi:hypothetical protein